MSSRGICAERTMPLPLILRPEDYERLHELRDRIGSEPPMSLESMRAAAETGQTPYGSANTVVLPLGFRVVFSREFHPGGLFRHMSMSSPRDNRRPTPAAIELIMGELGFEHGTLAELIVAKRGVLYVEGLKRGREAINVLELESSDD